MSTYVICPRPIETGEKKEKDWTPPPEWNYRGRDKDRLFHRSFNSPNRLSTDSVDSIKKDEDD